MSAPCEYCGFDLPAGVDRGTRRIRSAHFEQHARERRQAAALQATASPESEQVRELEAERDRLQEHLRFIERWAVHHGGHPSITAQEALSWIQHYPPIKAITKAYVDGKVPATPSESDKVREECARQCDELAATYQRQSREVGDRDHGKAVAANTCAAAIRAAKGGAA